MSYVATVLIFVASHPVIMLVWLGVSVKLLMRMFAPSAGDKAVSTIDRAIHHPTNNHGTEPVSVTYIFNGPVGIVQTGAGGTASVTVTSQQRQEIVAVGTSSVLDPALGRVADASSAAQKDAPKGVKLGGVLAAIGMGVQTVKNLRDAYAFLKAAAAFIGLPIL